MTGEAVFFIPHQDDEILSMGAYILQHIEAGRDVKVVLMTDGQNSGVRNELIADGFELSHTAFAKARDREFLDCLTRLGVGLENIYFEDFEDGTLTRNPVKEVMKTYIEMFDWGSYKTMSWMDKHKDHYVLGRSLDELSRTGWVPNHDVRFCRSLSYQDAPTPGGSWLYASDIGKIIHAADAYYLWNAGAFADAKDPISGQRYAIGSTSVESAFDYMMSNPKCWVHGDASGYTVSKRTEANAWLAANGHPAYL